MNPFVRGIYDRLAATPAFWGGLAVYRGSRTLFTNDVVPADAPRPYATILGPISSDSFDTKTDSEGVATPEAGTGDAMHFDFAVYADADGDASNVEDLINLGRVALHRKHQLFVVAGWNVIVVEARAAVIAPTDDTIEGRIVDVRIVARRAL